jgi:hypothetical protein
MKLFELAFACFLYGQSTDYDQSYFEFLNITSGSPDLNNPEHRKALLVWLNRWGCRQFALDYHDLASKEILSWHRQHHAVLPPRERNLWELTEFELTPVGEAYKSLSSRTASIKTRRSGNSFRVRIGPTGAAKILFAIRPHALPPWDDAIRRNLGYDKSEKSYLSYLRGVKSVLEGLGASCQKNGFPLTELPARLGRPNSSVPKLIDEYYWITMVQGCSPPDPVTLQRWVEWSRS